MALRRDALAGAAEWIGEVEHVALCTPGLVATVGQLQAAPNVRNAIPGGVPRQPRRAPRATMPCGITPSHSLRDGARTIATRRGLTVADRLHLDQAAVPMAAPLTDGAGARRWRPPGTPCIT